MPKRSPIEKTEPHPPISTLIDHPRVDSRKDYKRELQDLQLKLLRIQQHQFRDGARALVVFEGWDASGKGGAIRRVTEMLDPRGFRAYAIGAPSDDEQGRHYLWRFWQKLPTPGRIAIFDRSWYGRVLVERVEGFAKKNEWKRAFAEINEFERLLSDDGVRVVKIFLHITPEEQLRRFDERLTNPYKRWKLTDEDIRNRAKWSDYEAATDDMLAKTSTTLAPWHVVLGNHKWHARLEVLRHLVADLGKGVDLDAPVVDPDSVALNRKRLGLPVSSKRQ